MSNFQSELLDFLQRDVDKQIHEGGFDPSKDLPLEGLQKTLTRALSPTSADESIPLTEIIESYQYLFKARGPIHIEKLLMESFPEKQFVDLGLPIPRIYRGLPRVYNRDNPAQSHIKKNFTHLPTLQRLISEKAIFSLYRSFVIEPHSKVTFFVWVMNDGLGDYMAALEAARIVKEKFPILEIQFVVLVHGKKALPLLDGCPVHLISYENEFGVDLIPHSGLEALSRSDLILSLPTYYPHMGELLGKLEQMDPQLAMPKIEYLGEYGFLESSWFHPQSNRRCMGLHFLEKGILTRKKRPYSTEIENKKLLEWMFGDPCKSREEYLLNHHFYLAYLTTPIGGAVYLHALLKSVEREERDLDICTPDLGWFIGYVEMQNRQQRPLLEGPSVQSIEVYYLDSIHKISLQPRGKKVRLFCPGPISANDFQALLLLSGEFVGVRGDQSFSEVISASRAFFYDGREHARYFIKDLVALAENRIAYHGSALTCFRGMGKTFLHNIAQEEEAWVDETYFQEREDWTKIAFEIGTALQDPDTLVGYKQVSQIIVDELSCNEFLCDLVQRALCHRKHPEIALLESEGSWQTLSISLEGTRKTRT